jgi:hypothetical protein
MREILQVREPDAQSNKDWGVRCSEQTAYTQKRCASTDVAKKENRVCIKSDYKFP